MNRKKFNLILLATSLAVVSGITRTGLAQSADSATLINSANDLVRNGKITQAIDAYTNIGSAPGQDEQLNYNLGIAHYRNGDLDAAATLFSKVAGSEQTQLASNSQYNLGNCHYSQALQQAEADKPAAISELRKAISFYRGSLRGNPANADARANIELAATLMKQLEETNQQQEQPKQDQEQDPQQQPDPNKDSQDQEQSEKTEEQSSEKPQQQGQNESDQNESDQNESDQNESQQNESDQNESHQNESQQNESDQTGSGDQSDQSQSSQTQPQESKNEAASNEEESPEEPAPHDGQTGQTSSRSLPKQNQPADRPAEKDGAAAEDPSNAAEEQDIPKQPVPRGELTAANEQDKSAAAGLASQKQGEQTEGQMTREEALKLLQSVRDRDMLRRWLQQQRERNRRVPVDRDW